VICSTHRKISNADSPRTYSISTYQCFRQELLNASNLEDTRIVSPESKLLQRLEAILSSCSRSKRRTVSFKVCFNGSSVEKTPSGIVDSLNNSFRRDYPLERIM
jgi:hypothetical protein